jgi:manganese/zinc/iron transport system substrate-binding protein
MPSELTLGTRTPRARAALAAALAAALVFVAPSALAQGEPPLRVITTTGMIADLAAEVGGGCVVVEALMGPGIDPHLYRASAGDVDRLGGADLILYNGFRLEGQLGAVLDRLGRRTPTVAVAERIAADAAAGLLEGDAAYAGQTDPHLWLDAGLWAGGAAVVAAEVARLRPDCAAEVDERAAGVTAAISALHDWAIASLGSVPAEHRTLVTSHDAFRYFGRAYGLAVHGIEGISTESEASIADIRATADLVVATGVPALFVESTLSPRTIEAVQAAVADRGREVAIGGSLFGDAMGDEGTAEGTYLGMVRHNVVTIATALGGTVAPWPAALDAWAAAWGLR